MARLRLLVTSGLVLLLAPSAFAQETRYVYDALGQLVGVVDPQGQTVLYEYDAAGNLLAVRRPDTGGSPVAITFVSPAAGTPGTPVDVYGKGFSAVAGDNAVAFAGVDAPVLAASPNHLVTRVPDGATSGPITVTTPLGSAVSPEVFRVPGIAISPTQARVALNRTRQFRATVAESADQRVAWKVEDIVGGNATFGRITADGLYTAPPELPAIQVVRVQAQSVPFPALVAEAQVEILLPPPVGVVAGPIDLRVVRPGTGDPGGLATNLTVAAPPLVRVVRPGIGDAGGLPVNLTVAVPPHVSAVRPGPGDPGGLGTNVTTAAPPAVAVVRPGPGEPGGLSTNITTATPPAIAVVRPGTGDPGGLGVNVTTAAPPAIEVVRPGIGDAGGLPPSITVAAPPSVEVIRPGTGDPGGLEPGPTLAQPPDVRVRRE